MAQALTMQAPGAISADIATQTAQVPSGRRRRVGLVPMAPGGSFLVKLGARPEHLTAKDRRVFDRANVVYFCTGCPAPVAAPGETAPPYRMFADLDALKKGHASPVELERRDELHLYGAWSNDPIGAHDPSCGKCKAASAKAVKDGAPAETLIPCAEHHGGALGLLSPEDPNGSAS